MATSCGGEGRRGWSHLPSELLALISRRVADIEDFVRFGAVCKSWRLAATPNNLPPQLPWLLLPYDPDSSIRRFFSVSSQRVYTLDLPETRGHAIFESAHGWLIMADKAFSLSLFNPLTRARIHLPQVTSFPRLNLCSTQFLRVGDGIVCRRRDSEQVMSLSLMLSYFKCHVFVSGGEWIVAVTFYLSRIIMFCRVGDDAWTMLNPLIYGFIGDIAYHGGQFLIIQPNGVVVACDLIPPAKPTLIPSLRVPLKYCPCHLVALAGELLLVARHRYNDTKFLDIYKLDGSEQLTWSKIEDISNYALFLTSMGNMIIAVAGEASGCRRNCLYLAPHNTLESDDSSLYHVDVVSFQDGTKEMLPCEKEVSCRDLLRPTWITRSL